MKFFIYRLDGNQQTLLGETEAPTAEAAFEKAKKDRPVWFLEAELDRTLHGRTIHIVKDDPAKEDCLLHVDSTRAIKGKRAQVVFLDEQRPFDAEALKAAQASCGPVPPDHQYAVVRPDIYARLCKDIPEAMSNVIAGAGPKIYIKQNQTAPAWTFASFFTAMDYLNGKLSESALFDLLATNQVK